MTDIATTVAGLRRPRLLMQAARHGLGAYDRARHLPRLMRSLSLPPPAAAVRQLAAEEDRMEAARRDGEANYSVTGHVDLLIALLAEARLATELT